MYRHLDSFCRQGSTIKFKSWGNREAAVVWWLDYSPPTKANRVRFPVRSPVFSHVGIVTDDTAVRRVFSEISHFAPPLAFRRFSILPSLHLHHIDVKNCPNLYTPLGAADARQIKFLRRSHFPRAQCTRECACFWGGTAEGQGEGRGIAGRMFRTQQNEKTTVAHSVAHPCSDR
ncbi:hypothetical protein PR048_013662 [Dryococelus australis]|uniref:Uncharacterized protein n=1 Tax=Dryococelus australis TaxID=614101 RepID=A0ABQ9HSS8_9NEOP|nr:hypothetical protein PR048_013662 [Dryococelus australis]